MDKTVRSQCCPKIRLGIFGISVKKSCKNDDNAVAHDVKSAVLHEIFATTSSTFIDGIL